MQAFAHNIAAAIRRSATYSEKHFFLYGCLAWLSPIATIHDRFVADAVYDTLPIRLSAAILAAPLLFHARLRDSKFFPYYFAILVAYGFPFTFGYIMVANALQTPAGAEVHITWIFQYVIALFLFIQLTNNAVLIFILWTVATTFALLPILWTTNPNLSEFRAVAITPFFGYLTALLFGALTNRNIDIVNTEKIRAAAAIGSNVAHELRTPLASIRTLSRGIARYLPALIDSYERNQVAERSSDSIDRRQFEQLKTLVGRIESEVDYSNTIIDMLLVNTADKPLVGLEFDRFWASSAIEEAVARYPFNNSQEKQLIRIDSAQDFEIHAPRLLVVHVLFNLIKNGLYYVQLGQKGAITISTTRGETNQVEVRDTGAGIPPAVLSQIFEPFYTTTLTGQGAGIGLSFCSMVMQSVGGKIECASVQDEYTAFTLSFPTEPQRIQA